MSAMLTRALLTLPLPPIVSALPHVQDLPPREHKRRARLIHFSERRTILGLYLWNHRVPSTEQRMIGDPQLLEFCGYPAVLSGDRLVVQRKPQVSGSLEPKSKAQFGPWLPSWPHTSPDALNLSFFFCKGRDNLHPVGLLGRAREVCDGLPQPQEAPGRGGNGCCIPHVGQTCAWGMHWFEKYFCKSTLQVVNPSLSKMVNCLEVSSQTQRIIYELEEPVSFQLQQPPLLPKKENEGLNLTPVESQRCCGGGWLGVGGPGAGSYLEGDGGAGGVVVERDGRTADRLPWTVSQTLVPGSDLPPRPKGLVSTVKSA